MLARNWDSTITFDVEDEEEVTKMFWTWNFCLPQASIRDLNLGI